MLPSVSKYEVPRLTVWRNNERHLSGSTIAAWFVCSSTELPEDAKHALEASARRCVYEPKQIAWCVLSAPENAAETASMQPDALRATIEALDPLVLILADKAAAEAASRAYNAPIALESETRLLGRPCRAFVNFALLLGDEQGKQKAWSCLKSLHR